MPFKEGVSALDNLGLKVRVEAGGWVQLLVNCSLETQNFILNIFCFQGECFVTTIH